MRPIKGAFKVSLGGAELTGTGSVAGLKASREKVLVHDGKTAENPTVLVGARQHEDVTIKLKVITGSGDNIKNLTDMEKKTAVNDPDDTTTTVSGQIIFFADADLSKEAGRYNLSGCKILSLGFDDKERGNAADADEIEIVLGVSNGGWKT